MHRFATGNMILLLIAHFSAYHSGRVQAVTTDVYIDTALHQGNNHLAIPPADQQLL